MAKVGTKLVSDTLEICEPAHAAYTMYEEAVRNGFTYDPNQLPVSLPNGYAIIHLIRRPQ